MLKRINWKAILYGFFWIICLSGLAVLMSFIQVKKVNVLCKDVKVLIPGDQNLIERAEIDRILLQNRGPLIGKELNSINIHQLENALKSNPFIEFAKVYADMDGIIRVQIKQRQPILRILNQANQDYYIDTNGLKIPTSGNFTVSVLVANGQILEGFNNKVDTLTTKLARGLYNTALFIEKDTLWSNQIEQLYVNNRSEIEMIPRVGNQRIILGSADSLEVKFRNLLVFYKKAMPIVGWDTYKTINLKYANQIVCERNIAPELVGIKDSIKVVKQASIASIMDSLTSTKRNSTK